MINLVKQIQDPYRTEDLCFPYNNLGKYNFGINYIWIGLLDAAKFDSICNNCIYHVFLIKPLKCYENNLKDKLNFEAQ